MTQGSSTVMSPARGSDEGPPAGRVPLVALLNQVEHDFVTEFDRRLAQSSFCALSLAHSRNVLRHLGDKPVRASQLVEIAGVTKQAISQQLVHLERNGYVEVLPDPRDSRARVITLTPKGCEAQRLVRRLFVEIEQDWALRLPHGQLDTLRGALAALLGGSARGPC